MENPVKEIPEVIKALCQGSAEEQQDTIRTYFRPDAAFQHPLCRVPSLSGTLPVVGEINSRVLIMAIYRWYRLMSPKIDFKINSVTFNEDAGVAYVDMDQVFAAWFVPFYRAPVHFVVVLTLAPEHPETSYRREGLQYSDITAERKPRYLIAKQEDHYQLNDTVAFLLPWLGPLLCGLGQNVATMVCVILAAFCEFWLRLLFGKGQAKRTPLAYKPASKGN